jgi:hypothetical protein
MRTVCGPIELARPELLDQAVARDGLVVAEQQDRECRALSPAKPDGSTSVEYLKRTGIETHSAAGRDASTGAHEYRRSVYPALSPARCSLATEREGRRALMDGDLVGGRYGDSHVGA